MMVKFSLMITLYIAKIGYHEVAVLVAVNCSIPNSLLPSPPDLEVASVKIGLNKELILCTVYVPPNSSKSYFTSLFTYLSDLTCSPNQCLIVGDFNFPDICCSSLTGSSALSNSFCEFIFDSNLTQHVMEPTHVNSLCAVITYTHARVWRQRARNYYLERSRDFAYPMRGCLRLLSSSLWTPAVFSARSEVPRRL